MTHNFSYLLPAFQIINHEIKVLQSFKHKLKDPSQCSRRYIYYYMYKPLQLVVATRQLRSISYTTSSPNSYAQVNKEKKKNYIRKIIIIICLQVAKLYATHVHQ